MNLQDETIQLLVNLVEREQRRLDRTQQDCLDYDRRFRALLNRFHGDKALRRELLALTDLHNLIACRHELIGCRHKCFFFRAGIQLGISLGSIAVLSGDMPD